MPSRRCAGTMKASAWSPAGTTLLAPVTVQPSPACVGLGLAHVEPVARLALLVGQHHQRLAAGDARQPAVLAASPAHSRASTPPAISVCAQRLQHDAAAELLHHDHAFDRAHAHAAVRPRGCTGRARPELGQFVPGLAREAARGLDARGGARSRSPCRPICAPRRAAVPGRRRNRSPLLFQLVSPRCQPSTVCATMLRCTSLRAAVDGGLAHVEVGRGQRRAAQVAAGEVALPAGFHRLVDQRQADRARRPASSVRCSAAGSRCRGS